MQVLWARDEATGGDVVEALKKPKLARNTVMTMLAILERKEYAMHRTVGRTFVYKACVDRQAARRSVIDEVLTRFFDNSPEQLMAHLIESERISKDETERIRRLLDGDTRDDDELRRS